MTGARATNYGTRIDYIFGNKTLVQDNFTDSVIMPDVEGSDHCPVQATLKCSFIPAKKCPRLCSKFLPEFLGKQQTLSSFFVKKSKSEKEAELASQESHMSSKCTLAKAPTVIESKFFSKSAPAMKRSTSSQSNQASKKLKRDDKKPSATKQGTLFGFFNKNKANNKEPSFNSNSSTPDDSSSESSQSLSNSQESKQISNAKTDTKPVYLNTDLNSNATKDRTSTVNSWKNLLKGPPPAPLCKGHKEACVLRTVKKDDSLNKGRQFWVCQRPDGEKNNPLARCDHFEWVEKKKKKKDS